MKILLTGIAATGKSTIINALTQRGIDSLDLHEIPNLFFWQNKQTKEKVEYSPINSKEWFNSFERICDIKMLKEILARHNNIIVAGTTSEDDPNNFLSCFDKIILLQAKPETIIYRMKTRNNKSGYGKTEAEQEDNIKWQKEFDLKILSFGAFPLTTEGDLDSTISKIIDLIEK